MQKKNTLVIFTLLAAASWLPAQITITNTTFPSASDSLKTAVDIAPVGIAINAPGGPYTWDYSTLQPTTRQVTAFQPAAEGSAHASFPGAELVSVGALGAETYYDKTASVFSILGVSGQGLAGSFPVSTELKFTPPLAERHAPLAFLSLFNSASNATIAIPLSAIPGGILDSLGIPTGLFDSIRIRISIQRLDLVDAYGTLKIPGGMYDVLREKRVDYRSTGIDVHTFLGWVDISQFIGMGGGALGIGTDTITTFNYLSNTAKEPIAVVTVDSSGFAATQVEYKDLGIASAVNNVINESTEAIVSPNPASDVVTFELKNVVNGKYTLHLFNSNGQNVLEKKLSSDRENIYLQGLSDGLYLYHITDGNNQIIAAGKLVKAGS